MSSRNAMRISGWLPTPGGLILCGFFAIAAFFLITEHRAHVLGALPFVLFLLCPLMHFLLHWGHRGGYNHHHEPRKPT